MAYGKIKADTLVYDDSGSDVEKTIASLAAAAPTASPTFTGTVTIPTPTAGDNSTKAATTAFVATSFAPLGGATFTGTVNGTSLVLSADLTVNGTTTTINTTNLDVEDKNITLGKVSSPSDTTANGGGLTLKGASDKTITWSNSTGYWEFSHSIEVAAGKFFKDDKGNLRSIPLNSKTSSYTLVASDAGKCIAITTGGVTVPDDVFNANGGDAVTIINNSGSDQTITQGSGVTLYNTADGSTGNRTLAGRGMATLLFTAVDNAYISGSGLS